MWGGGGTGLGLCGYIITSLRPSVHFKESRNLSHDRLALSDMGHVRGREGGLVVFGP